VGVILEEKRKGEKEEKRNNEEGNLPTFNPSTSKEHELKYVLTRDYTRFPHTQHPDAYDFKAFFGMSSKTLIDFG
jgi:hypothetical protein